MVKTVVIAEQEQNWEDDAGAHDAYVVKISDEDYEELKKIHMLEKSGSHEELYNRVCDGIITPEFPIQIDDVLNIWYEF